VALAVGDLVDADPVGLVQAGVVEVGGDDPDHDRGHRFPGAAQQPGDGGLVGALGQVGDHVLEVAGEPGGWSGPGDRLGPHPPAAPARQPADLGLQEQPRGAQVQVPPAAGGAVIDRPGGPAARAAQPPPSAAQHHHDPGRGELHPSHVGAGDGQHLVECGGGAHASLQRTSVGLAAPKPTKDGACASSTAARQAGTPYRPSQPGRPSPLATHTSPRSPFLLILARRIPHRLLLDSISTLTPVGAGDLPARRCPRTRWSLLTTAHRACRASYRRSPVAGGRHWCWKADR
jgi:hypothetical protein